MTDQQAEQSKSEQATPQAEPSSEPVNASFTMMNQFAKDYINLNTAVFKSTFLAMTEGMVRLYEIMPHNIWLNSQRDKEKSE